MATGDTGEMRYRQPSRWGRNLVILALLIAVVLTAWFWTRMRASSLTATAYTAQTGCLCRYATGRSLESCQGDPGVMREWVSLREDPAQRSVTASVPMLASQTARWSKESGCVLEAWSE